FDDARVAHPERMRNRGSFEAAQTARVIRWPARRTALSTTSRLPQEIPDGRHAARHLGSKGEDQRARHRHRHERASVLINCFPTMAQSASARLAAWRAFPLVEVASGPPPA